MNAAAWVWPCDRRDAHGPHEPLAWVECEGVPAHPATMAGGNHLNARPEVQARLAAFRSQLRLPG